MRTYREVTTDNGVELKCFASNNSATYILTSARGHDMHTEFVEKYDRLPSSGWYNKHFSFESVL